MQDLLPPKKGYVYILTNPSFKEDWIKIGKSTRPVDVRSKELDNTAVPLPFEIYATMKTSSYNKIEQMLHTFLEGTGKRIRKNREFFNIEPEFALKAFHHIAGLVDDAEVYLNGEEPQSFETPKEVKPRHIAPKDSKPKTNTNLVEVHPNDNLIKNDRYTLDGEHFYSMAKFAYYFIKRLINDNTSLSYTKLESMFPKGMLSGYRYCGVLVKKEILEKSDFSPATLNKAYRKDDEDSLLCNPKDGIEFYVSTQWMRESFRNLLTIVNKQGYKVYRVNK